MAAPDYQAKYTDANDLLTVFTSEGVEFLLSSDGKVPLTSCNGKKICLFFSANWCRPCNAFTPHLVQLYHTLKTRGKELEIIFISFDRDDNNYKEHFKCMPWLAVPFDINLHKRLSERYQVDRIPSLIPLTSNGVSTNEDFIRMIEDYGAEAYPFTRVRIEELKGIDKAKREEGNIEELLAHEKTSYIVSRDGRQVPVSKLVGKTIGLYFCAHWSPPCRAFTEKLKEAYSELMNNAQEQCFEIILVSTDRNIQEFELNVNSMPWLVIPYEDKTRQDLCRIFDIKEIPALVVIGPDGKAISTQGRAAISLYGAKAFPFTESRIREIEAAMKKDGEALPPQVKDLKHEHVLKLDMAKAYVCDYCKKQGRLWAYSCDVCDYDLHPTCVEKTC